MNRMNKSLIITAVAGLSLGALVGLYSIAGRDSKSQLEVTSEDGNSKKLSMKAKRTKRDRSNPQSSAMSPNVDESASLPLSGGDNGGDGPKEIVSLEKQYIRNALKRTVIDTKTWEDTQTGRTIKGTLVKDDGRYGYLLVKQIYKDKEMTQVWGETIQIGDHIMVQFKKDQSKEFIDAFMKDNQLSLKSKSLLEGSYVFVSDVVSVDHMQKLEENLAKIDGVRHSEANYLMFASVVPNDPGMNLLWGFKNDGKASNGNGGYQVGNDMRAHKAWDKHTDCSNKIVAVLDTGIDYNHPDLKDNILRDLGRNFTGGDQNDYMDRHSHGTHCSGTIGGVGNNNMGVAGVCWKAKIVPLKVLGDDGSGPVDGIVNAVVYLAGTKIDIGSLSLGGGGPVQQMSQAIDMAVSKNKLMVIATGNANQDIDSQPSYPASYPSEGIISVSAYNGYGDLASFSNYGARDADIAAPGEDIVSTTPNNTYQSMSGTSMATPVTSGTVALFWSYGPNLSNLDVKRELLATADKGNFTKPINGNRKVNAERLLAVLDPRASYVNATKGGNISLLNNDSFEFQLKSENKYSKIKSVEAFNGTQSLGKADGEKVTARIPYGDGKVKITIKVTDEQGRTFTTEALDLTVDVTKTINLSAIDVGTNKGNVPCAFNRINEKMEKTPIFATDVISKEYCDKLCDAIL
ncbi:MAG: hypothetical protein EOP10_08090, partial [Proteobacteria bacterium]